jgi:uncharacterized Fe-S cluster protein YjdI
MEKIIEYTNGDLTIVWKPEICQHAGVCVKMLPEVYHPKERPWVKPENANTEQLITQILKCPSGALTYRMNDGKKD